MRLTKSLFILLTFTSLQQAHASCYLPLKYGKLQAEGKVEVSKTTEPAKFESMIRLMSSGASAASIAIDSTAALLKGRGYDDGGGFTSITIFAPTISTGDRHIFLTNRAFTKLLSVNEFGYPTSELVIQTQCGTVKLNKNGEVSDLIVEGYSLESKVGTSVPGATSSAGG